MRWPDCFAFSIADSHCRRRSSVALPFCLAVVVFPPTKLALLDPQALGKIRFVVSDFSMRRSTKTDGDRSCTRREPSSPSL